MSLSITIPSSFFGPKLTVNSPATKKACFAAAIECSSRPQKKATSHHMKTRPRKKQLWDIRRKPTVYEPLPPLPPDWIIDASAATVDASPEASPPPTET